MNLALAWRGAFMDAARHWKNRGGGHQNPAGFDVVRPTDLVPPLAVLDSSEAAWPTLAPETTPEGYVWKGYQLDQNGVPTFNYLWNGVEVEDRLTATGDFKTGGALERKISFKGKLPAQAFLLLAREAKITRGTEGFLVDAGKLSLNGANYDNQFTLSAEGATVSKGNLMVPVRNEIVVRYAWPALHPAHSSLPRASQ